MPPLGDLTYWARTSGLEIIILCLTAALLSRFIRWAAARFEGRFGVMSGEWSSALTASEHAKHRAAVMQAVERSAIVLLYFVIGIMVLTRAGVPVTTLLAPATVAGVALGFGAQRLVGDVLSGFFIVSENQYGVGDIVEIAQLGQRSGVAGTVERVSLRSTRMRTVTGDLIIVPNGEVRQVTNRSRDWTLVVVDAPVPGDADVDRATEALERAAAEVADDETVGALLLDRPTVTGVEAIEVGHLTVRLAVRTTPPHAATVGRVLRRAAAKALAEAGLSISASFPDDRPVGPRTSSRRTERAIRQRAAQRVS